MKRPLDTTEGTISDDRRAVKKKLILPAATLLLAFGCTGVPKSLRILVKPTERERYAREITTEAQARKFDRSYRTALADSLEVALPYGEKIRLDDSTDARSYTFGLQEGESVQVHLNGDSRRVIFLELLFLQGSGFETVADSKNGKLIAGGQSSGIFKLIVQPDAGGPAAFFLSIVKRPVYLFPVAGKTNSAIGSFWGQSRDGGQRSHEGIDIFAKRGTPVVAVADGTISYSGERGIGGKQVWLRTGFFGKSVYYAHLDAIRTESGQTVSRGDTLGFVGSTGNAKGGAPHLHFGVYGGNGATDPLPFVREHGKVAEKDFPRKIPTDSLVITATANLRRGPDKTYPILMEAVKGQKLKLLGESREWLHVRTSWGKSAFVHRSLVQPES